MAIHVRTKLIANVLFAWLRVNFGDGQPLVCSLSAQPDKGGRALFAKRGVLQTSHHIATLDGIAIASQAPQNTSASLEQGQVQRRPRATGKQKRALERHDYDKAVDKDNPPWNDNGIGDAHVRKTTTHRAYRKWFHNNPEFVSVAFWCVMCAFTMCCLCGIHRRQDNAATVETLEKNRDPDGTLGCPFDEDVYGMGIGLMIRDAHALGSSSWNERDNLVWSRIFANIGVLYFTITVQVFLLLQISRYITPVAVDEIRFVYSEFEWRMHGSSMSNGRMVAPDLYVGKPELFEPSHFEDLHSPLKKEVCHIPFSEPAFFVSIIFLWTFTCACELRKAWEMFEQVVTKLPTLKEADESTYDRDHPIATVAPGIARLSVPVEDSPQQILALSRWLKVLCTVCFLGPRIIVAVALLYTGCRWLAATNNFGDLIMNALALEFILLIKDMAFIGVVSRQSKRELANIEAHLPEYIETHHHIWIAFLWGGASLAWALLYTFGVQQTIPEYNWDVADVCQDWLRSKSDRV